MADHPTAPAPSQIDPLQYLSHVNGHDSPADLLEHYLVLKPALLRLQQANRAGFDVALREIGQRLKIKTKTVLDDLAAMTPPSQSPPAQEPLDAIAAMGQTHRLRFPQDFTAGALWFGILAGGGKLVKPTKLLLNSDCPRALAGINKLADTLDDRAIILVMHRKLAGERTERFSPARLELEAQALRDRCYLWALTHARALSEVYETADRTFPAMDGLDDRARDLWEPLVSIAALIDVERGGVSRP